MSYEDDLFLKEMQHSERVERRLMLFSVGAATVALVAVFLTAYTL